MFDSHQNLVVGFQTADGIFAWAERMGLYPRDSFVERRFPTMPNVLAVVDTKYVKRRNQRNGPQMPGLGQFSITKIENGEIPDVVRPVQPDNIALPPLTDAILMKSQNWALSNFAHIVLVRSGLEHRLGTGSCFGCYCLP